MTPEKCLTVEKGLCWLSSKVRRYWLTFYNCHSLESHHFSLIIRKTLLHASKLSRCKYVENIWKENGQTLIWKFNYDALLGFCVNSTSRPEKQLKAWRTQCFSRGELWKCSYYLNVTKTMTWKSCKYQTLLAFMKGIVFICRY